VIAVASFIGSTIEWYDFFLYGTAAALVFNRLFFPTFDPLTGTLAAFATYAGGFIARPLGAIVIGHYGDTVGRKSMLVLTLLVMGVATLLIGVLPTYEQIGVWAAVLLLALRVIQGFGVGGEWGGAILLVVEHAPANRRGFYGSWPQVGVPAGLLLSTGVFTFFSRLPDDQFLAWGWRVPFLLSGLLIVVGLLIRLRIVETPAFTRMKTEAQETELPILEVVRRYPRQVLVAMGARFAENGAFYIYSVFMLLYGTQAVHLNRQTILIGILIGAAVEFFAIPLYARLSDHVGRKPVYLFGAVMTGVLAYPLFWLFDTGSTWAVWTAMVLSFAVCHAPMFGPQAAFFSELFGTRVRYSGASLGAQLSTVLAGGLSPFIATALFAKYGSGALALYIIGLAAITIVSVIVATETYQHDIG
jgi:metabolite-proton symporter